MEYNLLWVSKTLNICKLLKLSAENHKKFLKNGKIEKKISNIVIFFKNFFPYAFLSYFLVKVWVKKNFSNLDCFSEKSFKSSKNTHAKDLKMVRQVNIVKKLPPGIMIKYKIHFWENTNFVKKEFAKKVILHLWVSCKLCLL